MSQNHWSSTEILLVGLAGISIGVPTSYRHVGLLGHGSQTAKLLNNSILSQYASPLAECHTELLAFRVSTEEAVIRVAHAIFKTRAGFCPSLTTEAKASRGLLIPQDFMKALTHLSLSWSACWIFHPPQTSHPNWIVTMPSDPNSQQAYLIFLNTCFPAASAASRLGSWSQAIETVLPI